MDFTEHAYVAAYFAARKPGETDAERLRVWAVDAAFTKDPWPQPFWGSLCRVARSSNPHLHAQSGVFVMWTGPDTVRSIGEILRMPLLAGDTTTIPLACISLPRSAARDLYQALALERITGSTMFPTADGVVRHMRERSLFDEGAPFGPRLLDL